MACYGNGSNGGKWMVVALTNSKGVVTTMICEGNDPELALEEYLRSVQNKDPRWLIHYERGFDSRADAERRAREMNQEIGATAEQSQSAFVQ